MLEWMNKQKSYLVIFGICLCFWIYLLFASQMEIKMDAIGYLQSGKLLYEQGWSWFFQTGPHREPVYLMVMAASHFLAAKTNIDFQIIQKIFQLLCLLITQLLALWIMGQLKIRRVFKLIAVGYIGLSPALLNAALSLYSEIVTLPVALLLIIILYRLWGKLSSENIAQIINIGILLGSVFLIATFAKAVFEHVFKVVLILFFLYAALSAKKRKWRQCKNIIVVGFISFCVLSAGVFAYKYANYKSNGNFQMTTRFDYAFFGITYKRTNDINAKIILSHLAGIPGEGVCRSLFSRLDCDYTMFYASDYYFGAAGKDKCQDERCRYFLDIGRNRPLLKDHLSAEEKDRSKKTVKLAINHILERPHYYALFCLLEFPKMFFWESTKIGFVAYPKWLAEIHSQKAVRFIVRFGAGVLTICAFVYHCAFLWRRRRQFLDKKNNDYAVRLLLMTIIIGFMGLYALFLILTRYAFPIAPFYIILIAAMVNDFIELRGHNT